MLSAAKTELHENENLTNSTIFRYCTYRTYVFKISCIQYFFQKTQQGREKYYLFPKTGKFCCILDKSIGLSVGVSKSAKYCLNHKGFHPNMLLS